MFLKENHRLHQNVYTTNGRAKGKEAKQIALSDIESLKNVSILDLPLYPKSNLL